VTTASNLMPQERWFVKYWRPAAAWVYLGICVFDFVAMPIYHLQSQGNLNRVVEISMMLRPEDQLNAMVQLSRKTAWDPLTLSASGLFHISFGAILGVAAWTRGRVQEEMVRNNGNHRYDDPDPPDHRLRGSDTRDAARMTRSETRTEPMPRPPRRGAAIDTQSY
jgi:hypothetical protein